ncbi:ergosteryl-beta-glucosidase [Trichomonascus vanleenenianus]|uniref:hydrolase n=1 Tax=Trichomonascus vanleenenianus TaxID=2268995 RepID=UPI003EC96CA8
MAKVLQVDGLGSFCDAQNRVVILRGINLDSGNKMPAKPYLTTYSPQNEEYWNGQDISFVGRPFSLEDAPVHLERIKSWGYNTIRYVYTWEALEHKGPGVYDDEFIDYSIEVLKLIRSYGFYVFMDPHQDLWSRFSGGSGAPLWTLYAAGLDPKNFTATEAALVQNAWKDPHEFPKMIWATNYARLACGVMFTLFFAGREYVPNAIINGVNIQDYLQEHMMNSMMHFYRRIMHETDLFDNCIIGVETLNEPNSGFIGVKDITTVPEEQLPKLGTCPTVAQSMQLGMGKKTVVARYTFGKLGPSKAGTVTVDPEGRKAWIQDDYWDKRYNWTRGKDWKLGECIFAQNGVWDMETNETFKPNYFGACPLTGHDVDEAFFVSNHFLRYWKHFYTQVRELSTDLFIFCQPPTNAIPPDLKGTEYIDDKVVYAPHFYDGLTLMLKKWNRFWNIDCIGILRGKYLSPIFGIKIGEQNIRNTLREELRTIRGEGLEKLGSVPCLMSETGMPMDMDDKAAYRNGDYTSQILALDALSYALEGADMSITYWGYCSKNTNECGDYWNGEDFSFWSNDGSTRAEESINRPYPTATFGAITSYGFDRSSKEFKLEIDGSKQLADYNDDGKLVATEVFIPRFHYGEDDFEVTISSGTWEFDAESRVLSWYHEPGEQKLTINLKVELPLEKSTWLGCGCSLM